MNLRPIIAIAVLAISGCGGGSDSADPQKLIAAGSDQCQRYAFDKAAVAFRAASEAAKPGSDEWLKANLGLAVALQHQYPIDMDRIAEAARIYEAVADQGGRSPSAAVATLHRGRIAEQRDISTDPVDLETARLWYQKVIAGWTDDAIAGEATLHLAKTWIQTMRPEDVRKGIELCSERASRPNEPWAGALLKLAGESAIDLLQDRKQSIALLVRAEAAGIPDPSVAGRVAWRVAFMAKDEGLRDVAIDHFRIVIQRYPTSGRAYDSQQHLRSMGIEPPPITFKIGLMESTP